MHTLHYSATKIFPVCRCTALLNIANALPRSEVWKYGSKNLVPVNVETSILQNFKIMRELIKYKDYQNSLCSIKPIENNFSSRLYFLNLLRRLTANLNIVFYANILRPYYETEEIVANINALRDKICELKISDDLFEISFHVTKPQLNDVVLQLIVDIWFEYEQPFFVIAKDEKPAKVLKILDNKFIKWNDVTETIQAYTIFRGAEEDVVWIGKSDELEFNID